MQDCILIITEIAQGNVHPVTYELIGKARELCAGGGIPIHCLVLGPEGIALSELNRRGCDVVYYMQDRCFAIPQEELFTQNIVHFVKTHTPSVILTGATNFGRSLAPRIAAALKVGLTADCTQLRLEENGGLIQIRPAFSGNILAHIRSEHRPQMATIRYKEFPEADTNCPKPEMVKIIPAVVTEYRQSRVVRVLPEKGVPISEADVIVAAGRGVRRKEDLELLRELADLLGGQIGVSRALVDAGIADSALQVGYSGHRVKPRLYIACGISGAPQHSMGMKESGTIIAVNSDASAPIFSLCHYGIVGDLYQIVPEMIQDISRAKEGM